MIEAFVEGVGYVNPGGFDGNSLVEEVDDLLDVGSPQDVDALHNCGFPCVLNWQNHPFLLVFADFQGDGQCAGLQRTIQRQFPIM